MMSTKCNSVFVLLCAVAIASADHNVTSLVNEKVVTFIDVSTQLVIVSNKITIINKYHEPIKKYMFSVNPMWQSHLSYIKAYDSKDNFLLVDKVLAVDSVLNFEIMFHKLLPSNERIDIEVLSVYTNYLQSYPKSVKQNDNHFVLFAFNVYHYSMYFTETQTTTIYSGRTEVTTIDGDTFKIGNDSRYGLQYGPYLNIPPESEYKSVIHYQTKSPFLTVAKLERFIQLSHWGYVTVRDQVSLIHSGPKFVGPFKRPLMGGSPPDTRVESFLTSLPEHAFDIYVNDEIGRISSFDVDDTELRRVDVNLKPRFVLYGGWKTQYEMGYTLPGKFYLSKSEDNHIFYFPLMDKLFPNMAVKEAKLNIILPEGAKFKSISPYFELENNTKNFCYYMDVICREVVSFKVQNLVEHHCEDNFSLTYSFQQLLLLMKPMVITMFLYTLFLIFLAYSWLTSNFPKGKGNHKENVRLGSVRPTHTTSTNIPLKQGPNLSKQEGKQNSQTKNKPKPKKR